MNPGVVAFTDHREEARLPARFSARFEAPHAIFAPSGPARIEEISACGLRLRTEKQLHPDEELVLRIAGDPFRVRARVIWVKERPPVQFGGPKTWIAGCRLDPESIGRVPLGPALVDVRAPFPWRKLLRVIGLVGLAGILTYLLLVYLFSHLGAAIG
jgi:hypothetical protein